MGVLFTDGVPADDALLETPADDDPAEAPEAIGAVAEEEEVLPMIAEADVLPEFPWCMKDAAMIRAPINSASIAKSP
jgi:hypothetical protein